jgi:hypothetical protein
MASTKRASTASTRKTAKGPKAATRRKATARKATGRKAAARKTATRKPGTSRRRSRAKQPSATEKLVQAVRSAKGPGIAAGAAASVVGGVALVVRSRKSNGFDARGLAKRIGETTKGLGKTSKELGKEMQRLGDDAEKAGKTLS